MPDGTDPDLRESRPNLAQLRRLDQDALCALGSHCNIGISCPINSHPGRSEYPKWSIPALRQVSGLTKNFNRLSPVQGDVGRYTIWNPPIP